MAYRDYQEILFKVLRQRIESIKKRKQREAAAEIMQGIREKQAVLNKFYTDYPYCKQCGGRRPKVHTHDGN